MEFLYIAAGFISGLVVGMLFMRTKLLASQARNREEINSVEKLWTTKLSDAEKDKLLAEQMTDTQREEMVNLQASLDREREKAERLTRDLASSLSDNRNLKEKIENQTKELEEIQKKFTSEFENIANKILRENSKEFVSVNQKNINEILNPLKEKIQGFEKKVEETYEKGLKDQTDLRAELKKLQDLNKEISNDAKNLTVALKGDVKKQGNWGEIVLERVLERSGLTEGQEYEREVVDKNMEGVTIRPDVIVHLPDKKHIIIDSKVSLVAYERYVNSASEEEKTKAIKEHLQSLKNHVKGLSDKHYPTAMNLNVPDFVLLFIPVESSFSVAVQADQELFGYAWDHKVVVVSPSTLLASLRTIASIWKQENQTRNILEIARQSGALYDKFVGFVNDMDKIGKNLEITTNNFEAAKNKLYTGKGNLVRAAEKIRELGVKTQKKLPDSYVSEDIE